MNRKYQYQVFNEYINLIVTVPLNTEEYAEGFARRTAQDFYGLEEQYLKDLNVVFICEFMMESVINVNLLQK